MVEICSSGEFAMSLLKVKTLPQLHKKRICFVNRGLDVLCLSDRLSDLQFRKFSGRCRLWFDLESHGLNGFEDPLMKGDATEPRNSFAGIDSARYSFSVSQMGRLRSISRMNTFADLDLELKWEQSAEQDLTSSLLAFGASDFDEVDSVKVQHQGGTHVNKNSGKRKLCQ